MLEIGSIGKSESVVTHDNTAMKAGSGTLEVFATPMLVALMENAAIRALNLPDDQTSVGTYMEVQHQAATPVGMKVWAEAALIAVDGRKLTFAIGAYDEKEKIGQGKHERFIVSVDKFMTKTNSKMG